MTTTTLQPFPQVGEVWAPMFPWPTDECPAHLYVHKYGAMGGPEGWTWAIRGRADLGFKALPMSWEAAVTMAWEFRYGSAKMSVQRLGTPGYDPKEPIPLKPSVESPARYGPYMMTIEAVGANTIWARREDGEVLTLWARDMRLGWQRVAEADDVSRETPEGAAP